MDGAQGLADGLRDAGAAADVNQRHARATAWKGCAWLTGLSWCVLGFGYSLARLAAALVLLDLYVDLVIPSLCIFIAQPPRNASALSRMLRHRCVRRLLHLILLSYQAVCSSGGLILTSLTRTH